jgi:hypothetical protein
VKQGKKTQILVNFADREGPMGNVGGREARPLRTDRVSQARFDRCGAAREDGKPSPEGEGGRRSLTDEALRSNIAIDTCLTLFSLRPQAQRKKLCKKEMPLLRALPEPASFLKKARPKIIRAISAKQTARNRHGLPTISTSSLNFPS